MNRCVLLILFFAPVAAGFPAVDDVALSQSSNAVPLEYWLALPSERLWATIDTAPKGLREFLDGRVFRGHYGFITERVLSFVATAEGRAWDARFEALLQRYFPPSGPPAREPFLARLFAAERLFGNATTAELTRLLTDPSPLVRGRATHAILREHVSVEAARAAIGAALATPNATFAAIALRAPYLGAGAFADVHVRLIHAALSHPGASTRKHAMEALYAITVPPELQTRVYQLLAAGLEDPSPAVRLAAARSAFSHEGALALLVDRAAVETSRAVRRELLLFLVPWRDPEDQAEYEAWANGNPLARARAACSRVLRLIGF